MLNAPYREYIGGLFTRFWKTIVAVYAAVSAYDLAAGQVWDDLPRLSDVFSVDVPWYLWVIGLLVIIVIIAVEGGYRQYRNLHKETHRPPSAEAQIAEQLASKDYNVGGISTPGDRLFLDLGIQFRNAISESQLEGWFYTQFREYNRRHPTEPISGEESSREMRIAASSVLNDWFAADLLERDTERREGARPSPTGTYATMSAMPQSYSVYSLSKTGISVLAYLKKLMVLPSVRKAMSEQKPAS